MLLLGHSLLSSGFYAAGFQQDYRAVGLHGPWKAGGKDAEGKLQHHKAHSSY